jgi:hypothetical protein
MLRGQEIPFSWRPKISLLCNDKFFLFLYWVADHHLLETCKFLLKKLNISEKGE